MVVRLLVVMRILAMSSMVVSAEDKKQYYAVEVAIPPQ